MSTYVQVLLTVLWFIGLALCLVTFAWGIAELFGGDEAVAALVAILLAVFVGSVFITIGVYAYNDGSAHDKAHCGVGTKYVEYNGYKSHDWKCESSNGR